MSLAERLANALAFDHAADYLTADLAERPAPDAAALTPAAVLVAITDRREPGVILTRRTETLRRHAGQIAFPGGRIDPGDADAAAAAIREAREEIALPPDTVRVVGTADRYRTATGYDITPVIAVVPPDLPLIPAEAEVAAVFEVPLAHVLDPANHRLAHMTWQGRKRRFYEIRWLDHRIWGATAAMLVNLSRRLRWT